MTRGPLFSRTQLRVQAAGELLCLVKETGGLEGFVIAAAEANEASGLSANRKGAKSIPAGLQRSPYAELRGL